MSVRGIPLNIYLEYCVNKTFDGAIKLMKTAPHVSKEEFDAWVDYLNEDKTHISCVNIIRNVYAEASRMNRGIKKSILRVHVKNGTPTLEIIMFDQKLTEFARTEIWPNAIKLTLVY